MQTQAEITKKIEKFLEKEFGAVADLEINPELLQSVGGLQRMKCAHVTLRFKTYW